MEEEADDADSCGSDDIIVGMIAMVIWSDG